MSGRYEPIAEKYLHVVLHGEVESMCECPFCSGKSSLQFNLDSGLWVCFRCDAKGNSKSLVRKLGGVYADPVVSVDAIHKMIDRIRTNKKREDAPVKVLEEKTLTRYQFDDDYWHDRGFSDTTIKEWDLGYDPIEDRNTIAYRDEHGALLGVIYRLKGNVFPRYIYPKGFDRKNSLFGSWKIKERKIALVEGSTDVIALSQAQIPSVAQYGSAISKGQSRLLHRIGVQEVVMFYDYDEAGRKAELRSKQYLDGLIIRSVSWDSNKYCWHKKLCGCGDHDWKSIAKCQKKILCGCGRKHEIDPGSLSEKEMKAMYNNAKLVGGNKKWLDRKYV